MEEPVLREGKKLRFKDGRKEKDDQERHESQSMQENKKRQAWMPEHICNHLLWIGRLEQH